MIKETVDSIILENVLKSTDFVPKEHVVTNLRKQMFHKIEFLCYLF